MLRRRADGSAYLPARGGLRRRSDGQLRALQGGQREDRARAFALSAPASTSTRCASATSSSRTNTRATSRTGSRIRSFAKRNAWSYIDARDLGQIVDLCLAKDGLGFQVFNAGNDDPSSALPTQELLDRFYPEVPVKRKLGKYESLYSNRKIRKLLGFKEQHNWRKYAPKKK